MGRKGNWFSSVKKVLNINSDSKKDQKHHHHHHHHQKSSKLTCFGHHQHDEDVEKTSTISVVPSLPPRKNVKPQIDANDEQGKQAFSLVLATAVAAGAAVAAAQAAAAEVAAAQAAAEVARVKTVTPRYIGKSNEEIAAITIQTALRRYLARRTLRGLRGLVRLKTLVQGQSVQRQAATTLQCMQTLSRLQSQVSARKIRMSEENQSFQRQMQQKREKEIEKLQAAPVSEKWDVSSQSKEQIEAKMLNRQVAAMRRERALAYSSTHQQTWRNSPKSANATIMDPNDPHWGWNWLDRWMATRPWEGQNTTYEKNNKSAKNAASHTMSVGEITRLYTLRDQNQDVKNTLSVVKSTSRPRGQNSPISKASPTTPKAKALSSPKVGGSWGGDNDSKTIFTKIGSENNRRHSIAVSPVRDNNNNEKIGLTTSPASTTRVTKVKSKIQSTPSAKKQLSFGVSPVGSRRHSVPTKVGMVSNKNVAAIPEEKVKVRNGGSR